MFHKAISIQGLEKKEVASGSRRSSPEASEASGVACVFFLRTRMPPKTTPLGKDGENATLHGNDAFRASRSVYESRNYPPYESPSQN